MPLTKEHFKYLVTEALEHIYEGEDGSLYGAIAADGDMKYDLLVAFFYEPSRIVFSARSPNFSLKDKTVTDIVFFCNKWNTEYLNQCCYYEEKENAILMSGALFTDEELDDKYILENFIHFYITTAIRFFTIAEKEFS